MADGHAVNVDFSNWRLPAEGYEWQPVKTWQLVGWLIAYALIMYTYRPYGARLLDAAYLVVHEAGHPLFSYLGSEIITVLGGTIFQLLIPALLALGFAWRGHTLGTAFCSWAVFNSLTGVAIYMADARARELPLVAPGMASDEIEGHDWNYIFNWLGHGMINEDTRLANITLIVAWIGMFTAIGWLIYMWRTNPE
jgi:hypothetical protein